MLRKADCRKQTGSICHWRHSECLSVWTGHFNLGPRLLLCVTATLLYLWCCIADVLREVMSWEKCPIFRQRDSQIHMPIYRKGLYIFMFKLCSILQFSNALQSLCVVHVTNLTTKLYLVEITGYRLRERAVLVLLWFQLYWAVITTKVVR